MSNTIIPFPLHRVRPPLFERARSMAQVARADHSLTLWDPLPTSDGHRISCADLCEGLPGDAGGRSPQAVASAVVDFAILGLYAIQTGQWMRPDLLGDFLDLQAQGERVLSHHGLAYAQRA